VSYTDSAPAQGTLALQGVWLHDPLDPQESARQYRYGGPPGQRATETPDRLDYYAGRELPVVDYSPHRADSVQVAVTVPFGPNWSDQLADFSVFALARRSLTYRDSRGRNITGRLSGYMERDERHGTTCSFDMTRAVA